MKLTAKDRQAVIRKWLAEGLTQSQTLKALAVLEQLTRNQTEKHA